MEPASWIGNPLYKGMVDHIFNNDLFARSDDGIGQAIAARNGDGLIAHTV